MHYQRCAVDALSEVWRRCITRGVAKMHYQRRIVDNQRYGVDIQWCGVIIRGVA
jgi:hypothetical protein